MSKEHDDYIFQTDNQKSIDISRERKSYINFIFQGENKISIPLYFLKTYPNSLLSLIYERPENYLEDDQAYYVDSPSLSIDKLMKIICNSDPLDSFSSDELIDLDKTVEFFLGNDSWKYRLLIHDALVDILKKFIYKYNCELDNMKNIYSQTSFKMTVHDTFTEERNKLFYQYSHLFEYFNIDEVTLKYDFDDRIPYEYVYPHNLHELFPKLKNYSICASYYPLKKYLQIRPIDNHYFTLYKEYKRQYYCTHYPEAYYKYRQQHPEIENYRLIHHQIYLYPLNNHGNNEISKKEKEKEKNIHHEIIPIDIDEEIRNEKEDEKPNLYIESSSDYSRVYNEEMIKKEKEHPSLYDKKSIIKFDILFTDDNGSILTDKQYPLLTLFDNNFNDIFLYFSNFQICKQIRSLSTHYITYDDILQLEIPPLLLLLKDSLFASLEIFDFSQFINEDMYPEYIQLFKDIISTHVFPNVTTLRMNSDITMFYENSIKDILLLITRDRFPKLSIYYLPFYDSYDLEDYTISMMYAIVPISLLNIINIMQPSMNQSYTEFLPNEAFINHFIMAKKQHNFYIKVSSIVSNKCNYSLCDFSVYPFKTLHIIIDSKRYEILHALKDIYKNMNFSKLQKLKICFNNIDYQSYDVFELINEYFSFLCLGKYRTVTTLSIEFTENIEEKLEQLDECKIIKINDLICDFFSLFSDNIETFRLKEKYINLPLWSNIQRLSLSLDDFDLSDFLQFIELFKSDSSISLPFLMSFTITLEQRI
ncbi:hypothetical protein WA158_005690 [Blastocystis sp. Blastoise]